MIDDSRDGLQAKFCQQGGFGALTVNQHIYMILNTRPDEWL